MAPLSAKDLPALLSGVCRNDNKASTALLVEEHEEELKRHGKQYDFYRRVGVGHGFWYYDRAMFRSQQVLDSFGKVLAFFERHLN